MTKRERKRLSNLNHLFSSTNIESMRDRGDKWQWLKYTLFNFVLLFSCVRVVCGSRRQRSCCSTTFNPALHNATLPETPVLQVENNETTPKVGQKREKIQHEHSPVITSGSGWCQNIYTYFLWLMCVCVLFHCLSKKEKTCVKKRQKKLQEQRKVQEAQEQCEFMGLCWLSMSQFLFVCSKRFNLIYWLSVWLLFNYFTSTSSHKYVCAHVLYIKCNQMPDDSTSNWKWKRKKNITSKI